MDYSLKEIVNVTNGVLIGSNQSISNIVFDSRVPFARDSNLFIAIVTEKNNGHLFVQSAYKKGIRSFLVNELPDVTLPDASYILVDDTLLALQQMAAHFRKRLLSQVVAVTGSNGKTTVKEWLYQILKSNLSVYKSPKSYNSQLGVALSVLQADPNADLAVFEAGISKPAEMERLEEIIEPEIGVITNLGDAHDANFSSREQKLQEKLNLFTNVEKLIYCCDQKHIHKAIEAKFQRKQLFSWGYDSKADLTIKNSASGLYCIYKGLNVEFQIREKDRYHIENIMHCVALCFYLKVPTDVIQKGIEEIRPIPMRLEMKQGQHGTLLVNDSYSADFKSLEVALEYLFKVAGPQNKTLIVSEFDEQKIDENTYQVKVNDFVKRFKLSKVCLIGEKLRNIEIDSISLHKYDNTAEFIRQNDVLSFANEAILIKGARRFKLESLLNLFQAKSHRTRLEISMSALRSNYNFIKSTIGKNSGVMVMLKALGYGAGTYELARLLQNLNAEYIAVAYIDEGVELRQKGIELPIMVLNPEGEGFSNLINYRLEPEVYSLEILDELLNFLKERKENRALNIHINIDTGMHRLGFNKETIKPALHLINRSNELLKVKSVFTHLAASDDANFDEFTQKQLDIFKSQLELIKSQLVDDFFIHAANTAGILRHESARFDMVRLGIGFYGIDPSITHNNGLELAFNWVTQISQINEVQSGESVGYSRSWMAKEDVKVATIPVGYADGLSRKLSNENGWVYINGLKAPIVGAVCMDMCMVNVKHIDCKPGDKVVIFENHRQLKALCEAQETIPYELLAQISGRVKRVYLEE
ncbi:MAG: bifunctional UDP-N-acetylmuramoyl-tripeptide:D-alanyl-D-alanine ligase/alanine racemase [Bacteroidia bacterium]